MILPRIKMLFSLVLLTSAASADVQLAFRNDVMLIGRNYVLDDVADVQSADLKLARRLRAVVLGDTPRPGQSVAVTQIAVGARLERVFPGVAARIQWSGDAVVRVRSGAVERDGAQLTAVAKRALLAWLHKQYGDAEVTIDRVGEQSSFDTPAGEIDFAARLSQSAQLRSRMPVWVDVTVDGYEVNTIPVWFAVEAYTDVAVANQKLPRHAVVTTAQVIYERRNIAELTAAPIVDELPDQHRTRHRVSAGDVIAANELEPIPQVQEGELITVLARHGSVAVAVEARALGDGNVDEAILVRSLSSHAAYRAIVSGIGQATVE